MDGVAWRRLAVVAWLALGSACGALDSDGDGPPGTIEVDVGDVEPGLEDPCLCEDELCLQEWMKDNGLCDQCAVFVCEELELHACAVCPGDDPGRGGTKTDDTIGDRRVP